MFQWSINLEPKETTMKVVLDLSRLLDEGTITRGEHDRLAVLGRHDTGLVLVNVLVGFGVLAVALGTVALVPSALVGAIIGGILMATGVTLKLSGPPHLAILSTICILIASLLLGAGLVLLSQGVATVGDVGDAHILMPLALAFGLVAVLFGGCAALARSGLLAGLATLLLFAALGGSSYYDAATYGLQVTEPFATVVLFSALALVAHVLSRGLAPQWERLATIVARVALFLANLGFWVGSLWGDDLGWLVHGPLFTISAHEFAVAWALLLVATGLWAGRTDRRWVLNLVAVFGGIHFYTQWFEWVGATPGSLLIGGLVLLTCAILMWRLNHGPDVTPAQHAA
jgi:iron complex transport system permease protein